MRKAPPKEFKLNVEDNIKHEKDDTIILLKGIISSDETINKITLEINAKKYDYLRVNYKLYFIDGVINNEKPHTIVRDVFNFTKAKITCDDTNASTIQGLSFFLDYDHY